MIGAIIGDVVGSRFEFRNIKTKEFELFHEDCSFTDDTVMTVAIADIVNSKDFSKTNIINTLKYWGNKYPNAGYGGRFINWLFSDDSEPYYSCGNGSAMRISPIGFYAKTEKEVIELSNKVTEVTHNHPEGLKGAEVTAMLIFKARHGATKEELYKYAVSKYPEIKDFDYNELVINYYHGAETCQVSVPQALYCFFISKDFVDCIRTIMSIGGDCDTTGAIAGGIAEAFYGVSENIKKEVMSYLPSDMIKVIEKFKINNN